MKSLASRLLAGLLVPEEQVQLGHGLKMLDGEFPHGRVLAGGIPAGQQGVVMIVDLHAHDSHGCVRHFLTSLPIFSYYDWEVTPLETYTELLQSFAD